MNCRILGGLVALSFLSFLSGCKDASEFQPELSQGGRIVSIVRAPNRPNEFLAAAETGGLFRSVDGGYTGRPSRDYPAFICPMWPMLQTIRRRFWWRFARTFGFPRTTDMSGEAPMEVVPGRRRRLCFPRAGTALQLRLSASVSSRPATAFSLIFLPASARRYRAFQYREEVVARPMDPHPSTCRNSLCSERPSDR